MSVLVANPASGATSPCDGPVNEVGQNTTFSTLQASSGNQGGLESDSADAMASVVASTTTNQFSDIHRAIFNFDTSAISSSAIQLAVLSLSVNFKNNALGKSDLYICGASPASTSSIPNTAFTTLGATGYANIAYDDIFGSGYNYFPLNSSGVSHINTSGISSFGTRVGFDILNSFTGTWASGATTQYNCLFADNGSSKPTLSVIYGGAGNLAFEAQTCQWDSGGTGSTKSFTHPGGSGSNRIALVFIAIDDSNQHAHLDDTVTYGGSSMTMLCRADSGSGNEYRSEIWYLVNPPTGSQTVSVNYNNFSAIAINCITLTGAAQSAPTVYQTQTNLTGTAPSVSLTPSVANSWIFDVCESQGIESANSGQVGLAFQQGQAFQNAFFSTTGPVAASAQTVGCANTSTGMAYAAVAIAPFVSGGNAYEPTLMLTGVGF